MSGLIARAVEHVHGHAGWLATLALAHPAWLLRRPRRRAYGAATAATGLVTLTAALGAIVYPAYRSAVKPLIYAASPVVGDLFERKEHLGIAALVLAWVGLALHLLAHRDGPADEELARLAFAVYVGAAVLAALAAGLGLIVGVYRTF